MSRSSIILFAALLLIATLAGCQQNAEHLALESTKISENQLHQLLLERQRILEGIAEDAKRWVDAGRMTASEHAALKKAALLAGLDLCETRAERIEIREEVVRLDRQAEAWIERRAASGRAGEGERDQARLTRIESEIGLLRELLNKKGKHDKK